MDEEASCKMKLFVWKFNDSLVEPLPAVAVGYAKTKEDAIEAILAAKYPVRDYDDFCKKDEIREILETKEPEIIEGAFGVIADEFRP